MSRPQPVWLDPDITVRFDVLFRPLDALVDRVSACPWSAHAGMGSTSLPRRSAPPERAHQPLYTAEQRARRDATWWTTIQGILAPVQFLVFLVSLALVVNFLLTGEGYAAATVSIIVKTLTLYAIMITGSIWEKEVFGKWLFASAFFWEDVFSMLVLALHTAYLAALATGWGTPGELMVLALAAYATYVVNATQFVLKLRAARLEAPARSSASLAAGYAA